MLKFSLNLELTRLDVVAIAYAILLSLACLARGAIYDVIIALMLLSSLPLLALALSATRSLHSTLLKLVLLLFATMFIVLCLQWALPSFGVSKQLWQQVLPLTNTGEDAMLFYNKAAWMEGQGRLMLALSACLLALCIGSTESSARHFLNAVMLTGGAFLTLTFFTMAANGLDKAPGGVFRHGFISANSAAAYLGLLLLLAIAQTGRLIRQSGRQLRKLFPDIIDKLNLVVLLQSFFMMFCLFLFLASLLTTSSRGGIGLTMLSVLVFFAITAVKMHTNANIHKRTIALTFLLMIGMLGWIFLNFGQIVVSKLERQGMQHHSRLEIIASVMPMVADHPWLGVGAGNFAGVYQQYRATNVSADGIIDKAHNSYIEFASEYGVPAFAALLLAVFWVGFLLLQGVILRRERYVTPALGLSVWLLVVLHSLFDFPLQVPALAAMFIAIILVCASQSDPRFSETYTKESSTAVNRIRIRKRRSSAS